MVGNGHLAEAGPAHEPTHEPVALRHRSQRLDYATVHQPEVAGVERDARLGEAIEQPVERVRRRELEWRLTVARHALAIRDVVALAPPLHHLRNDIGRILQIRVDEHHRIASRVLEPRGHGNLVAEVARQAHDANMRIRLLELLENARGAIAASVVDVDDLVVEVVQPRGHSAHATVRFLQHRFFIEAGHHDRE